jgi:citronellol/citronellal dehydrogenase
MGEPVGRSRIFAEDALAGVSVLITGGGTGLGKASALELARCGAAVTIAGRRREVLEEAVAEAVAAGAAPGAAPASGGPALEGAATGSVDWVQADVRDPESARKLVAEVLARRGRLDVLVNNAGGQFFSPAELIATKGWRAVWRLNVEGMLNLSEAAHELALGPGGGTIINVTLSPHHGMPGMAHSGAARATVEQLTCELARRWAPNVVVVAVAAGHFATEVTAKYPESVRAGASRTVPVQRLGEPIEHAWLVTLLASSVGRAFNGSTVTLDGGRDNWFGPWPPPGLAGEGGEVPVEERKGTGSAAGGPGLQ